MTQEDKEYAAPLIQFILIEYGLKITEEEAYEMLTGHTVPKKKVLDGGRKQLDGGVSVLTVEGGWIYEYPNCAVFVPSVKLKD